MEGMCLDHFVTNELMRSFERILGKNGHTFLPMSLWKEEGEKILKNAWFSTDFQSPCFFCAYKDKPECMEYRKAFVQSIVPNWFQEQMDAEIISLCSWDEKESRLHFYKKFDRAVKSGKEIWVADDRAIRAEAAIAKRVKKAMKDRSVNEDVLEKALRWTQVGEEFKLSKEQEAVVRTALSKNFVIVDGGPGTGKTTILRVIYQYYLNIHSDHVFCCAPTGKAAKRMGDVTNAPAQTLHRLLGATYDEDSDESYFYYTKNNHHLGKVFLIDEASMIDCVIFSQFLEAVDDDAVIVLVGDSHQLPSVGAGRVLADLIGSGKVPVCTLVENFRQVRSSMIVKNASNILHGKEMEFPEEASDIHFVYAGQNEILDYVAEWIRKNNPDCHIDAWREMAILCPRRNGPVSTDSINEMMQKLTSNRRGSRPSAIRIREGLTRYFSKEDRVIQIKNDYRLLCKEPDGSEGEGVFNGDIGFVREITPTSEFPLDILFDDGRRASYPVERLTDLELAYALTVHKAQGGEWKKVLLVLPPERGPIFNRNLLYTAVTRAKNELWIVGDQKTISFMISSQYSETRETALKIFLEGQNES